MPQPLLPQAGGELAHQARLADAGLAGHEHDLAPPAGDPGRRLPQRVELAVPPEQHRADDRFVERRAHHRHLPTKWGQRITIGRR
jgi:hypothetical protein